MGEKESGHSVEAGEVTSQERVLQAVCRGYRYANAIARAANVPPKEVYTHLRRLRSKDKIEVVGRYGKEYRLKDIGCLLAEAWK